MGCFYSLHWIGDERGSGLRRLLAVSNHSIPAKVEDGAEGPVLTISLSLTIVAGTKSDASRT